MRANSLSSTKKRVLSSVGLALLLPILSFATARAQPAAPPPQLLSPPQVITHVDAHFPADAMKQGLDGIVVLFVTVGVDGSIEDVAIAQSAGKSFDDAAVTAIRQWKFAPARRGNTAVKARIRVPFHFAPPTDVHGPALAPVPAGSAAPAPSASVAVSASASGSAAPAPTDLLIEAPGMSGGVSTTHDDVHRTMHGTDHLPPAVPPAASASSAAPTAERETSVTIIGRTTTPNRGASDYHVTVGALREVPRKSASEMLKLAPGILLTNEGGEGHAEQVFLRGFDAREGQDIEFTVGGIPINEAGNLHGNGHADLHFIIPELVDSIRVIEGPFDPRQGNFAVAGSADYELGLARRGLTARYTQGSFGTQRMLLLWGPSEQSTRTFGAAELFKTDGFGQNRDARRGSVMGQYEGRLGEKGSYRITAQAYTANYHGAGVLRDDDYRTGRKGFFDTYDFRQGGDSSRFSVGADLESRSGNTLYRQQFFLISSSMRMRKNYTGFLLDTQEPAQNPHDQRGDGIDLSVSTLTMGARGSSRFQDKIGSLPQELELGYYARGDIGSGTQLRVQASNGVPYKREADNDYRLGNIGLYGDLNLKPTSWISLRGGMRADLFTYDVLDKCAQNSVRQGSKTNPAGDASCLSQQDFGRYRDPTQRASTANSAFMPRASLLVGPFKNLTFSASYGQGVRSIDPIYISQDIKTPFARVVAYEAGASYAGGFESVQLVARTVFFQTKVERDLVFSETAGRNTLANGTTRSGIASSLRATGSWFDQSANITLVKSTFDDTSLVIPYIPDLVIRSDSVVHTNLPVRLLSRPIRASAAAGVTFVGHRPLPYGQRSDSVFTLDSSAGLQWREYELGLSVSNLLDNRYRLGEYNYASDFQTQSQPTLVPVRHFTAGPPRTILFTIGGTVGGES